MRPGYFGSAILALALLVPASCRSMGGNEAALLFPTLRAGVPMPADNARLTGTLIRDGAFLRVDGGGSTVIVWPRGADAASRPGIGTVVVVWPRGATLERRGGGGGTTIVVWPRTIGSGIPVRVGERVELSGIVLVDNLPAQAAGSDIITSDNVSGRVANCPPARGCRNPLFIVSAFRPAPPEAH
ncbi:MAG: hypothetical protein QOI38_1639 [Sphingomonadales bacterium]|jgi:hypothetical protein|nr:hypothetical protein [Sphingomonadales bacterium]